MNKEWKDYEEPKEHWAIDQFGEPINVSGLSRLQLEKLHRLGNDFPSENATMKAIEKCKAWKRLKDKGFKFTKCGQKPLISYHYGTVKQLDGYKIRIEALLPDTSTFSEELDLLFGGEE